MAVEMVHFCMHVYCRVRLPTLWLHFTATRCLSITFPPTHTPCFCWSMFSCCWSFRICLHCDAVRIPPSSSKLQALLLTEYEESRSRSEMSLTAQTSSFSWQEYFLLLVPQFWGPTATFFAIIGQYCSFLVPCKHCLNCRLALWPKWSAWLF